MAQEYTIKAVKTQAKEWESAYGPMKTYLIQVDGNGEPVQINKKADSPLPKVGDTIYGDIEDTQYGQKFKSQKRPFNGGSKYTDHHEEIKAQWAIGQAVQLSIADGKIELLEEKAKNLYAMVDRVKGSSESTDPKGTGNQTESTTTATTTSVEDALAEQQAKRDREIIDSQRTGVPVPDVVHDDFGDEPINLDDIPF